MMMQTGTTALPGEMPDHHERRSHEAPVLLASLVVPGLPEQVGHVRRRVRGLLGAGHPVLDEVELLITETVTNAIRHTSSGCAGGTVSVRVLATDRLVRIETVDTGNTGPSVRLTKDLWAEEGRGLWLIAAIAARHGYHRAETGGTYWFEVTWE